MVILIYREETFVHRKQEGIVWQMVISCVLGTGQKPIFKEHTEKHFSKDNSKVTSEIVALAVPHKMYVWGEREGSVVKGVCCAFRELEFGSQHPHQVDYKPLELQLQAI